MVVAFDNFSFQGSCLPTSSCSASRLQWEPSGRFLWRENCSTVSQYAPIIRQVTLVRKCACTRGRWSTDLLDGENTSKLWIFGVPNEIRFLCEACLGTPPASAVSVELVTMQEECKQGKNPKIPHLSLLVERRNLWKIQSFRPSWVEMAILLEKEISFVFFREHRPQRPFPASLMQENSLRKRKYEEKGVMKNYRHDWQTFWFSNNS